MGVITIEFADRVEGDPCPCCGFRTIRLTRFVYPGGDAHAIYYAAFTPGHQDRHVSVVVSLGEWGDGATPNDRFAFGLRIRCATSEFQVMVTDATESPWHGVELLGRMLDRNEALQHPWIHEVFHITDHIVADDPDVRDYFEKGAR